MARDDLTLDPPRRLADLLGGPSWPAPGIEPLSDTAAWRSWLATSATGGHGPEPQFGGAEPGAPPSPDPGPPSPSGPRRRPGILRGARLDPGRRGAVALVAVALLAAVVAVFLVWGSRPRAEPLTSLPVVTSEASAPVAGTPATTGAVAPGPAPVVVSVTGKVARPGLVTVSDGARVADVLAAAGGPLPGVDVAMLNLARRVADGEQVAVGVPAAPDAGPAAASVVGAGSAAGGVTSSGAPVDLNAASVAQLDTLPGVGPVTAQRIVEWRSQHGRFARVEQLREIDGIGERRFAQLRELVRI